MAPAPQGSQGPTRQISLEQLQFEQVLSSTLAERAGLIQQLHQQLSNEQCLTANLTAQLKAKDEEIDRLKAQLEDKGPKQRAVPAKTDQDQPKAN